MRHFALVTYTNTMQHATATTILLTIVTVDVIFIEWGWGISVTPQCVTLFLFDNAISFQPNLDQANTLEHLACQSLFDV